MGILAGYFARLQEQTSAGVPTPTSGSQNVFVDSSDHVLKRKDSSATVTAIGGASNAPVSSIVDLANAHQAQVQDDAGNFTYGDVIVPLRTGLVVTGIRCYWIGGAGAKTLKLSLWATGGSSLATANVSVNAAGIYSVTFGSPQTLTAGTAYVISAYETGGTHAIKLDVPTATGSFMAVSDLNGVTQWPGYWRKYSYYHAGDAAPSSGDSTELLGLVEPIFQ